ncbi:glycosyltransferase family 4 protein [Sphingopyxis macrogoltabida]|uniref:Glycosyltransferase subfamily 4-like N-terminal domain-containing protein n=1 Tax=Sphingopyxis macrogoltabida TaxID=33050 RepID=A0A0N9V3F3_SPHMC|nr:glycosyltransferase family 4 protein [Sphingopyxis macrogoltabida]ALH82289.1 hypothetical protein AN936_18620 [Sphingopyxis macrogoltabida]
MDCAHSLSPRPGAKVVAVSEYTERAQNSTGYFWYQATEYLRAAGISVHLASYTREMTPRVRSSVLLRLCLKLLISLRLAMKVARSARRGDVVFSGTNPEILLPMLVMLKPLLGFRLCVLVHDVFPENLGPAGVLKSSDRAYALLSALYRWIYGRFDATIVIGRDMQKLVDLKAGNNRSTFVHNWVDQGDVQPLDRLASGLIASLGWQDHVVFQFYGNMGRLQGIDGLLRGIERVQAHNAAFLFVGSGVMQGDIEQFCAAHPRSHYVRSQAGLDRSTLLATCDVALVCLQPGMFGLGVPSKAYFSLAADRPLLAIMDEGSEIALMVQEHRLGWTCIANDPDGIAATIDAICGAPLPIPRGRCRALMETSFSAETALDRLTRRIEEMLA